MNPNLVYLVQTDTTVGFVSQDKEALARAKGRDPRQPFLRCVADFGRQKRFVRTPRKFRKYVRRSRRTTFLYPNHEAIRVVGEGAHHRFLARFSFMYSTSANAHQSAFDPAYARKQADVVVEDARGFFEGAPSPIYQLGRRKKRRLR